MCWVRWLHWNMIKWGVGRRQKKKRFLLNPFSQWLKLKSTNDLHNVFFFFHFTINFLLKNAENYGIGQNCFSLLGGTREWRNLAYTGLLLDALVLFKKGFDYSCNGEQWIHYTDFFDFFWFFSWFWSIHHSFFSF